MKRLLPDKISSLKTSEKGAYILEFRLASPMDIEPGVLGKFNLKPGWYYYTGSARNGLRGRLSRHILGPGKLYWHIDYLTVLIPPVRIWTVLSDNRLEKKIAGFVESKCDPAIPHFGCGDSPGTFTHLFYSSRQRNFLGEIRQLGTAMEIAVRGKISSFERERKSSQNRK